MELGWDCRDFRCPILTQGTTEECFNGLTKDIGPQSNNYVWSDDQPMEKALLQQ